MNIRMMMPEFTVSYVPHDTRQKNRLTRVPPLAKRAPAGLRLRLAGRSWMLALFFAVATAVFVSAAQGAQATGVVFHDRDGTGVRDPGDEGIPGVLVSNQREIAITDGEGRWKLPVEGNDTIFFVIKPRGWQTALSSENLPRHYYIHRPSGSPPTYFPGSPPTGPLPESIDFPLRPQEEPDRFKAVFTGDPQPRTQQEAEFLAEDVAADVAGLGAAFGVSLGDIVFDNLDLFGSVNLAFGGAGLPWYNVVGNHDLNFDARNSHDAVSTFERVYGPSYYAFQYGPVHFLVLNNIRWEQPDEDAVGPYQAGFGERQMDFIRNYLALAPHDELVVLMMHIPFLNPRWRAYQEEIHEVYELLAARPHAFSMSAHMHRPQHRFIEERHGWPATKPHHHFVAPTISGSIWRGLPDIRGVPHATAGDGSPRGYALFTFDGADYSFEFVPAGIGISNHLRIAAPLAIRQDEVNETEIFVNAFAGSPRSGVEMRLGGEGEWHELEQTVAQDPVLQGAHERERYLIRSPFLPVGAAGEVPIWKGTLRETPRVGPTLLHARTRDMFGQTFYARRSVSIEPALDPANGTFFHDFRDGIRLRVPAAEGLREDGAMLLLNGEDRTDELAFTAGDDGHSATFNGLENNRPYHAVLRVITGDGRDIERTFSFDTFDPENFIFEAEHFNFGGGQFIQDPPIVPDVRPNYRNKASVEGIDRGPVAVSGGRDYRPQDAVGTGRATDFPRPRFEEKGVSSYVVGWNRPGEWLNYTREFPPGRYHLYARLAASPRVPFTVQVDRVTSDPSRPDQTTEWLGEFSHRVGTGNWHRFDYVLLRDSQGKPAVIELDGKTTLRVTAATSYAANFYLLVPADSDGLALWVPQPVQAREVVPIGHANGRTFSFFPE